MSTRVIPESELPAELTAFAAVDTAYPTRARALPRRAPPPACRCLVECEKELAPYIYRSLRDRLQARMARAVIYLDGRAVRRSAAATDRASAS